MNTMERTLEREFEARRPQSAARRAWPMVALVVLAVLALFGAGMVGRWTAPDDEPAAVVAGGGGLTDRQEQMVDMMSAYAAAWRANDSAALTAMFTPEGVFDASSVSMGTHRIDDGTLATFAEGGNWSSLVLDEPMFVDGDRLVFSYQLIGVGYLGVMRFTSTGDLQLVTHEVIAN